MHRIANIAFSSVEFFGAGCGQTTHFREAAADFDSTGRISADFAY
jgi:hypothetical protein